MKSFVKVNNGCFPNLNYYMAWEAFNQMGYSVTLFEEKDIDNLDITINTPVFAGVTIFRRIIDKLKVNYPPFDCYPEVLQPYYGRTLIKQKLRKVKKDFLDTNEPVFVKPVLLKQFNGNVWKSMLNLIPLAKIPDDADVWVSQPVDIISEFRVYVNDGEILGVKHYYGDWSIIPNKFIVEDIVKEYKSSPIAYGIDFAVTQHPENSNVKHTIVLEVNDACNLGNYGLDSIHYGEMLVNRWFEIVSGERKNKAELKFSIIKEMIDEMRNDFTPVDKCDSKEAIGNPIHGFYKII